MEKEEGGSRTIDVWVTLGDDGKVAISFLRPVLKPIMLCDRIGLYPEPSEMIWIPGQCHEVVERVLGRKMDKLVPLRCQLGIVPKDELSE